MPTVRFSRDKRGYEYVYLVHTPTRRGKPGRTRMLYWYRTPPGVRLGRQPFDPEVQKLIEQQNPGLTFDWDTIVNTPMPPPDMTEYWRERRRQEKAAKQERRAAEAAEAAEAGESPEAAADAAAEPDSGPGDAGSPADGQDLSLAEPVGEGGASVSAAGPDAAAEGVVPSARERRRRRGGRRRRQDGGEPAGQAADADAGGDDEPEGTAPSGEADPSSEGE